ncbi:MAG TPA: hypothetical protein VFW40_00940 [Capsulimonadaceae bacterium]|nr:hypothetical protein [Capsulimonadaceae bacterium]
MTIEEFTALFGQAVRNALADHKAAGNPVAEWRNGKVVIVQPEDIDLSVFDEPATTPESPK